MDSTPSQGNLAIAEFAAELCAKNGLHVEKMNEFWADQPQMNVLARPIVGHENQEFLLQTHLDTPDPGPFGLWNKNSHNPFDAHIIDGKIFGLGAADVKLDFLCKLEALRHFKDIKNWKVVPVLVGTFGEEQGMVGTLKIIRKNKIQAKWALVSEPSNLQLIRAGKGMAAVEIRIPFEKDENLFRQEHNLRESSSTHSKIFRGKPAHSSTPHLGESAIKKMLEHLKLMPEDLTIMEIEGGVNFNTVASNAYLEIEPVAGYQNSMAKKIVKIYQAICDLESEFLQFEEADFQPQVSTLSMGVIRTLEDHVFISGNCRTNPSVRFDIYQKWMNELKNECAKVGADFRVTDYKVPFSTDEKSEFVQGCVAELGHLGLNKNLTTLSSTNEASLLSRIGIECLCFGAGLREGNIHTPNEHVDVQDLKKATEFYKKTIERFCL